MHIKQIIIQGFKSYRDQTVVEPFDKRHNVVVGRNGSGKSNFFSAIQFVLSDEFSHLRPEQRQGLLHEGTGPRVLSAFVEIIFDNSDSRVPIEKDEVYLRRVIGAKKDQYFLNKKMVPRTEVMNLLESAGFSNSNPYYIVKQGKINQMATAPDSQRLKLLREVAGTRVYDERREESMAILREAEGRVSKIEEFLQTIEDKLSTLREEKEELSEYQKWDKTRRSLEYVIHEKELNENKKKLEELELQRKNSGQNQSKYDDELKKAQQEAKLASKKLKDTKKELQQVKEEKDAFYSEIQQLQKEKIKLELVIKDLDDEVKGDDNSKKRAEKELEKLETQISAKEDELNKLKPQYEEMKRKEEEYTRDLTLKEQKRKELYAKQGRVSQFASKEDRDNWIKTELKSLNKQIRDKTDHHDKLCEDIKNDARKKIELEDKIMRQTEESERQKVCIDEYNKVYYEKKKERDTLQDQRTELWRKETNLQQELDSSKEELARADQSLRAMAGKPILNGRDSVRKVLETFRQRGGELAKIADKYYGPVIENFTCERSIYTAVEVTAGNRLFHHIIQSDTVGTAILKEMNRQGLPGEVTFMPLNRLLNRNINYPNDNNAIPMVSKLTFETKYEQAIRYIFGKTLICRNLEIATQLARSSLLDCVTLEGDQVSAQGSLTGGFFNQSRSRLEVQQTRTELMNKISQTEHELAQLRKKISELEGKINNAWSEMQKIETKNSKAKATSEKVRAEIRLMKEEVASIDRFRGAKEKSLQQCKSNLEVLKTTKESLESELHQDLLAQLSVADQREVDHLNDEIQRLNKENKEAFGKRMKLETEKNKLENLLTNNLYRRRDELKHALQEISLEDRMRQLQINRSDLENVEKKLETLTKELSNSEKKIKDLNKKVKDSQIEYDRWKNKENEINDKIQEDSKSLEKIASKQNLLQQKIAECTEKINQLGALPAPDLYTKHSNMSNKALFKELEKANSHLKKFSHVNKKALDQFLNFSEQKEKLSARKEELDRGETKIRELLQMLENRKVEAIQFTFKQVSKNFSEVFKKLVPSGRAQLVMRTNRGNEEIRMEDMNSDNFTGVGIKISFTEGDSEMREMNQLSGGQKSLVALALIFAIQKCDPAPFYLFDEIDQALDAQHRKAVADMIHELSSEAQFITTTFRPELLEHANKFYGVKFRNKVSHIECVTKEVARDFVEDDQTHG